MYSLVAMKESMNRPDSAKCGSKGVALEHRLFRVRVCYFYLVAELLRSCRDWVSLLYRANW